MTFAASSFFCMIGKFSGRDAHFARMEDVAVRQNHLLSA